MKNDTISARNLGSLITIMILCATLFGGSTSIGQDSWLLVPIAFIGTLPLIFIYSRTLSLYPGFGLFDILPRLFGKVIGIVVIGLFSIYALFTGALALFNFSEHTVMIALENTPRLVIMAIILLVSLYLAFSGINNLGRWSFIICIVVMLNIIFTLALSFGTMDFSNIQPMFSHSLKDIASDSLSSGVIAFGETVLAMGIFSSFRKGDKPKNAFLFSVIIGSSLLLLVILRNILVLGSSMFQSADFPSYTATRIIHLGTFLEHVESLISFNLMLMGVTKITLCIHVASIGISKAVPKANNRILLSVSGVLIFIIAALSFHDIEEIAIFIPSYRLIALIFIVLMPAVIWIFAEIKKNTGKRI